MADAASLTDIGERTARRIHELQYFRLFLEKVDQHCLQTVQGHAAYAMTHPDAPEYKAPLAPKK